MNDNKKIGYFELSEILNKYFKFITILTVLFAVVISVVYYTNNINQYVIRTSIVFNKELHSTNIDSIIKDKRDNLILDSHLELEQLNETLTELGSFYVNLYLINRDEYIKNFFINNFTLFEAPSNIILGETSLNLFFPEFSKKFTNYEIFKASFNKNEIYDEDLILHLYEKINLELPPEDTATQGSQIYINYYINYKLDEATKNKIKKSFEHLINNINLEINRRYLDIIIEEFQFYKNYFEKEIEEQKIFKIQYLINTNNKFFKWFEDNNDFLSAPYVKLNLKLITLTQKIEHAHLEFIKMNKLNNHYIEILKEKKEKDLLVITSNPITKIIDENARKNIIIDSIVVMLISLFFGFILSMFLSIVWYIKSLYLIKN